MADLVCCDLGEELDDGPRVYDERGQMGPEERPEPVILMRNRRRGVMLIRRLVLIMLRRRVLVV